MPCPNRDRGGTASRSVVEVECPIFSTVSTTAASRSTLAAPTTLEIAYVGDTLNTSARIQQACREFQRPFLVSADMVDVLQLPSNVEAESLGSIELRGVESSMELFAITRTR